jgi:hypothetical protein
VRFGSTVQDPPPGPAGLPGHQRHFQPLFAEAPALAGHRGGGNLKSIGDTLVGPVVGSVSVSLEQYAPVEQLSGVSSAAAHERFELGALLLSEADDVFLVHAERIPVGLVPMRISARLLLLNVSVTEN